jgi:hypothetical protein
MNLITNLLKTCIPAAAAVALLGGCKSEPVSESHRDAMEFNKAYEVSDVTRLADTQIALGARTDATLRPYHFNEAELNSLGREKINLMLRETGDDTTGKLVVYVDVPATGEGDAEKQLVKARQNAVSTYLVTSGRAEDSFRLEAGFNPNDTMTVSAMKPAEGADGKAAAPAAPAANKAGGFGAEAAAK